MPPRLKVPDKPDPYAGQRMIDEDRIRDHDAAEAERRWRARDAMVIQAHEAMHAGGNLPYQALAPSVIRRGLMNCISAEQLAKMDIRSNHDAQAEGIRWIHPADGRLIPLAAFGDPNARTDQVIPVKVGLPEAEIRALLETVRWCPGGHPIIYADPETGETTATEERPRIFARVPWRQAAK